MRSIGRQGIFLIRPGDDKVSGETIFGADLVSSLPRFRAGSCSCGMRGIHHVFGYRDGDFSVVTDTRSSGMQSNKRLATLPESIARPIKSPSFV
jgi:hypothetical protein